MSKSREQIILPVNGTFQCIPNEWYPFEKLYALRFQWPTPELQTSKD